MDFEGLVTVALACIGAGGAALTAMLISRQHRWSVRRTDPVVQAWAMASERDPSTGDLWVSVTNRDNGPIILHQAVAVKPRGFRIPPSLGRSAPDRGELVHPGHTNQSHFPLEGPATSWPEQIEITVEIQLPDGKRRFFRSSAIIGSLPPIDREAQKL